MIAITAALITTTTKAMIMIQSDPDIARLSRTNKYVFFAYIGVLAATVILSVFLWISGNKLQDAIKRTGEARTEEAKRGAEEAHKQAIDATNEGKRIEEEGKARVAEIQRQAANDKKELENKNLELQADLNRSTTELRTKQAELTTEQTKLAGEQRKTADAQRAADEARLALQKHLEQVAEQQRREAEHAAPRHLTDSQRAILLAHLKDKPKPKTVKIDCIMRGGDNACEYAAEIASILEAAGWPISPNNVAMTVFDVEPVGVLVIQRNPGDAIPAMRALAGAFEAAGIPFKPVFEEQQKMPEDEIKIIVGTKP